MTYGATRRWLIYFLRNNQVHESIENWEESIYGVTTMTHHIVHAFASKLNERLTYGLFECAYERQRMSISVFLCMFAMANT